MGDDDDALQQDNRQGTQVRGRRKTGDWEEIIKSRYGQIRAGRLTSFQVSSGERARAGKRGFDTTTGEPNKSARNIVIVRAVSICHSTALFLYVLP